VRAVFAGSGGKKILLIAHMDTVYRRGQLAQQPFRIEGNRAYGLGIGDDKQGVALIVHTIALLRALAYDKFGTITVLINGDEATGTKLNWTLTQGGSNINVIPALAEATADMRVLRVEDYAILEDKIRSRVKNQLLPAATVEVSFFQGRPPLAATPASVALAS